VQVAIERLRAAAVGAGPRAIAQRLQEVAHEPVVAEVGLRAARGVQRPGTGVVARDLAAGGAVAGLEQPRGPRVSRGGGEVVKADERLQEAVEHAQPGGERVDEVVAAAPARRAGADAERRLGLERAERAAGDLGVARVGEQL
jgi:hypothetical protein